MNAASGRDDEADVVAGFASTLVAWQREHGRQSLPWQQLGATRDAYRVWLAEVMLQQTQVAAVVPYYRRFLERFPDVRTLAAASSDDLMQQWSGLGYYSRARNLHAAAKRVVDAYGGRFPDTVDALQMLPGVGRSTAGAIAAFAYGRRAPILDGNVRRVLTRVFAVTGIATDVVANRRLWALSEALLPEHDIERYTQGLMDLGATICTPRRPTCLVCPFERVCLAHRQGREEAFPERAPRKAAPVRDATLVVVTRGAAVLLERRPPVGLWGGLWSLPQVAVDDDGASVWAPYGAPVATQRGDGFVHAFTHFVLHAAVLRVRLATDADPAPATGETDAVRWVAFDALSSLGLPTPVRALLERIAREGG